MVALARVFSFDFVFSAARPVPSPPAGGAKEVGCKKCWVAAEDRDLSGAIPRLQKLALGMWTVTRLKGKEPMLEVEK